MKAINFIGALLSAALLSGTIIPSVRAEAEIPYTDTFPACRLKPWGVNDYFIPLKPGSFLVLEGEEMSDEGETETIKLRIDVLRGTKVVAGVRCSIVRETEWKDDELVEISWNYFAICCETKAIFYYGEDVDIYEDGEVVSHAGAWLAGVNGNRPGLIMPGLPLNGSRYFQEIAPGVALDRAEHLDNQFPVQTPAGTFHCLLVLETTPLEPDAESFKAYAPGIGLVQDDVVKLVDYGRGRGGDSDDGCDDDDDDDLRESRSQRKSNR